ncbi:MAG: LysM peptidoglycan-binding domain-containing protein [Desulfobacterales bacterium]|nr:LysM peptidoglycan-binding domain-containing protein [Desulfobacterales bacterium]
MQERDIPTKDNFVMSGKKEEREEAYDYVAESGSAKRSMKPIVIAGAVLLGAIVVVLMFLSGSPRSVRNMEARLKAAEEKLVKLEWIDTGLARLDRKEKEMAAMSERMLQLETAMNKKVDQIAREAAKPAAAAKAPEPAPAPRADAAAHKPEPAKPTAPAAKPDPKAKTHVVQKGDTLYGISRKYGVPADQLMKANKLGPKDAIKPGQQLVIPAKVG